MGVVKFVVRCSKDCGEGGSLVRAGSVVRCSSGEVQQILCKDCGEVVNNWLVNF